MSDSNISKTANEAPTIEGAKLLENKRDYAVAIEKYKQSIDHFQECEIYDMLISSIISLGMLQARAGFYNEAERNLSKSEAVLKRISDPLTELTVNTNKLYLSSLLGNCSIKGCDHVANELETYLSNEYQYYEWWLLAKAYYQLKSNQKAEHCQKNAQDQLDQASQLISDKNHRKTFLYSDYIKKEIWSNISEIDIPIKMIKVTNDILKLCPNCGRSNENQNKFCSGCGNNLRN